MTEKGPNHPISLAEVIFTKCVVEALSGHRPAESPNSAPPVNEIEVSPVPGRPGEWTAMMKTVVNADKDNAYPYHVEMQCAGVLVADDTLDTETARRGVMITAHSVLYGAIRETVAWLTSRQPYGPLLLGLSILRTVPAEGPKSDDAAKANLATKA